MESEDQAVIKALPGNDTCSECRTATNPTWCSVSFGVLVCLECSGKHRGLGTHISFVRSLDMDHFTPDQVRILKEGGNETCNRYLLPRGGRGGGGDDVRSKYDTPKAQIYKKWLLAKVEGKEAEVKEYEQQLIQQQSESSEESSAQTKARHRVDFTNTTPAPSFRTLLPCTSRLIVGMASDGLGPRVLKCIVGVFLATATLAGTTARPTSTVWIWAQRLTLGVTGTFLGLLFFVVPLQNTIKFSGHRISAFKSTVQDFTERVYAGRAKRNPGYDIFFPPGVSIGDSVDAALIFYPGLLVDFMAYSKLLGKLSDRGILVLLVNTEPNRMIDRQNGYTADHAQNLMFEIGTLLGIQIRNWALGGHSMGGYTAAWLSMELGSKIVKKCVLLASGNGFHLSQIHKQDEIQILTIDASNDRILLGMSPSGTLESLRRAAQAHPTRHVVIEGGNHAGFGHYGPQVYPKRDGERIGITLDEQQEQTLKAMADFLTMKKREPEQNGHKKQD